MNAALLSLLVLVLFVLGYRFYSGFLTHKVFRLSADEPVKHSGPTAARLSTPRQCCDRSADSTKIFSPTRTMPNWVCAARLLAGKPSTHLKPSSTTAEA